MDTQDRVRDLTAAFLDAHRERIAEGLSERLKEAGSADLLPAHCALLDVARAEVREPDARRTVAGVHGVLAEAGRLHDARSLIPGQMALWALLHRMLREVEGPQQNLNDIHAVLALTGGVVDGVIGVLLDVAHSGDTSVAFPGWETRMAAGRTYREFQVFNRIIHDLMEARDPGQMFATLRAGIVGTFHIRSLMIAAVNCAEGFVEVVNAYPSSPDARDPVGWRFDLSHPDILCEVARTGRMEVIDGWDPRYHEQVVEACGRVVLRQRPRDFNEGQTAFFVPILARHQAIGVVCTASTQENRQIVLSEIERMRPFLDHVGVTLAVVSEIAERRRAEEALAESEKRLRTIIEAEPECVKVITHEGILLEMNRAGLDMIEADSLDQVVGQSVYAIVAPEHLRAFKMFSEGVLQGKSGTLEFEIVGLKGTRRWLETRAVPLRNFRNELVGLLGITRDISERKRAEEARRAAERELEAQRALSMRADRLRSLGEMAAGIAHELNQPLTGVRGLAEHLLIALDRRWDLPEEKVRERLTAIVEQADRMSHIIEHVRMFSREADRPECRPVDVNEVVRSALDLLDAQFRSRGIRLGCELGEGLPCVLANPFSLEEVVLNLLLNARDAVEEKAEEKSRVQGPGSTKTVTGPGSRVQGQKSEPMTLDSGLWTLDSGPGGGEDGKRVWVRTRREGTGAEGWVVVEVADEGVGIAAEFLERVFDPFFTTKGPDRGTGLGLSVSRSIVEGLGGKVQVRSEPGRGTTVTVSLPVMRRET